MILALDTSTETGQLALYDSAAKELLREESFAAKRNHNSAIFPPLESLLQELPSPPSLIVVGTGPGSYNGVRVGISVALGLSLSHQCPTLGLPSIVSLSPDALVVGDARRSSFYTAEVRNHQLVSPPKVHDEDAFRAAVASAELPVLTLDPLPPLGIGSITVREPSASRLAELAAALSPWDLAELASVPLEPLYVRAPYITQPKPNLFLRD